MKNRFARFCLVFILGVSLTGCGNSSIPPDYTEDMAENNAEVSAEYTPVGYFDYTEEFLQAVFYNPVLEGWGNKIVQISDGE